MDRSIVFEVFTDTRDETEALEIMSSLEIAKGNPMKETAKKILGPKGVQAVKKIIH